MGFDQLDLVQELLTNRQLIVDTILNDANVNCEFNAS